MVRIMAIFDPGARALIQDIGKRNDFDTSRARAILGIEPRPVEETIVECAESLAARDS
jgi:dihydroflavonol-4-reductase